MLASRVLLFYHLIINFTHSVSRGAQATVEGPRRPRGGVRLKKKKHEVGTLVVWTPRNPLHKQFLRDWRLLLMFVPVLIYYLVFCYLPMVGIVMGFEDFKMGSGFAGLFNSRWVGLQWFRQFFSSAFAWRLIRNTFLLSFYSLIFGFPIPILFAIAITQLRAKRFGKVAQVITYLPYFISTVVVVGMMTNFLSPSSGIVNQLIVRLGGKPINFMSDPRWFRRLYVISGSWQTFGFNSIICVPARHREPQLRLCLRRRPVLFRSGLRVCGCLELAVQAHDRLLSVVRQGLKLTTRL